MPILKNAKKALRQSHAKAVINRRVKSQVKTAQDALRKAPSTNLLTKVFSALDKAAKGNIIHPNKAARLKSQASRLVK